MISPVESRDAQLKLLGSGTRVPSFGVQLRRNPREEQRSNMRNIYTVSAGGYQLQTNMCVPLNTYTELIGAHAVGPMSHPRWNKLQHSCLPMQYPKFFQGC